MCESHKHSIFMFSIFEPHSGHIDSVHKSPLPYKTHCWSGYFLPLSLTHAYSMHWLQKMFPTSVSVWERDRRYEYDWWNKDSVTKKHLPYGYPVLGRLLYPFSFSLEFLLFLLSSFNYQCILICSVSILFYDLWDNLLRANVEVTILSVQFLTRKPPHTMINCNISCHLSS